MFSRENIVSIEFSFGKTTNISLGYSDTFEISDEELLSEDASFSFETGIFIT